MPIPIALLTGFLGSGKTTVLNQLVRQPELSRTLVIVNELGEVGLDHLLKSRVPDDAVVEMSSGCLCCTVRGDQVNSLEDAHWRYARGGERQFGQVVIEITGLAILRELAGPDLPWVKGLLHVQGRARRDRS